MAARGCPAAGTHPGEQGCRDGQELRRPRRRNGWRPARVAGDLHQAEYLHHRAGSPIQLPPSATEVHHEGELAIVIGRPCKDVPAARAAENILGYTIGNDVSARDHQRADGQWTRAKGHDTFCPLGPWIVTDLDPADLEIRTEVNGQVRQRSRTSLLLHDVGAIVEWVSAVMTLLPGDVILTGTPEGVGPIVDGDTVSVTIEGIGTLSNPVVRKAK